MKTNKFKNKPNKVHQLDSGHVWHSRSCVIVCHVHCQIDSIIYVLVGKRGMGKNKGKYNVPCGYLDWSENIENAMYRELWEESGLYIPDYQDNVLKSYTNAPWFINSEPSNNLQNIIFHCGIYMKCTELPKLSLDNMEPGECESAEWISIHDIEKIGKDAFCFNHDDRAYEFNYYYGQDLDFQYSPDNVFYPELR